MSKLWIFGDSYGVQLNRSIDWFWADQLAAKLECSYLINRCVLGAANDFTQYRIMREEENISSEDYVVVISTCIDRKWFFKEAPYAGNFFCNNLEDLVGKESAKAVEQYVLHLMNPETVYINFHQFLGWIHYKTDLKDWNLIVIPGFEEKGYPISHRYNVTGSLFDVCNSEFSSNDDQLWYYRDHCRGRDQRSGHLIRDNHDILAKKIYKTFKNSCQLDLTSEFKSKMISKSNINFLKDQFVVIEE